MGIEKSVEPKGQGHMCEASMGGNCGNNCNTISGAYHCHKNWIFRKLFVLIALLFMFWMGLRLGELRALDRMMDYRQAEFSTMSMHRGMEVPDVMIMPAASATTATPTAPAAR